MNRTRLIVLLMLLVLVVGAASFMVGRVTGTGEQDESAEHEHGKGRGQGKPHERAENVSIAALIDADAKTAAAFYAKTCAGCHGVNRQGAIGPSLIGVGARYPLEKIEHIAQFGKGRKKQVSMPAGLASPSEADLVARWLVTTTAANTSVGSPPSNTDSGRL